MPSIRHETYYSGDYLLRQLDKTATIANMIHDGGDIILFETPTGERVSIHMIESGIPVYEIRKILSENDAQGIHTLFMLWCTMMVPNDGQIYRMTDWMQAFVDLNGDRVYAYDIFDSEVYLFSVFFRQVPGNPQARRVEYGTTVRAGRLAFKEATLEGDIAGTWKVAYFGQVQYRAEDVLQGTLPLSGLDACYALLGIEPGDDRETIKQAYRLMARRYHPDHNPAPDATDQMQKLNEAYQRILSALDEQSQ